MEKKNIRKVSGALSFPCRAMLCVLSSFHSHLSQLSVWLMLDGCRGWLIVDSEFCCHTTHAASTIALLSSAETLDANGFPPGLSPPEGPEPLLPPCLQPNN